MKGDFIEKMVSEPVLKDLDVSRMGKSAVRKENNEKRRPHPGDGRSGSAVASDL